MVDGASLQDCWSAGHVQYDLYTHQTPTDLGSSPLAEMEQQWRDELVNQSVHGRLLLYNSFFQLFRKSSALHMLHLTADPEGIERNGAIYPSGGCLIGSIYSTPLFADGGRFRLHNLGAYLFKHEAPASRLSKDLDPTGVKALILELIYPETSFRGLVGVDYLRLGDVHLNIYRELNFLLSLQERMELEERIMVRVRNAFEFLKLCHRIVHERHQLTGGEFISLLVHAIELLPILGYFYFEVLSEYLMLYSDDDFSSLCSERGEFNSWGYKELLFSVQPSLRTNFNLGAFKPTVSDLRQALSSPASERIVNISIPQLSDYVKRRLSFLICARLFRHDPGSLTRVTWKFVDLIEKVGPLLGHLIHRELRNFGRYPDFYFYFDQQKALQAWNYWNQLGALALFNGVIPKGEMGPNPAFPNLKYKIYETSIESVGDDLYAEPGRELNVRISPRLVDLKYTFLRNSTGEVSKSRVARQ